MVMNVGKKRGRVFAELSSSHEPHAQTSSSLTRFGSLGGERDSSKEEKRREGQSRKMAANLDESQAARGEEKKFPITI